MSSAKRFSIYPFTLVHTGGTLNLAQVQGFNVAPQPNVKRVFVGGAIDPKAHILVTADAQIPFQTRDLATLLGAVSPLTGTSINGGSATFRLQERDDAESVFLSTATHETYSATRGHVCIESIGASQDDQDGAVAQLRLYALYDGTNLPIVHTTAVDFAGAPSPAFTSEFWLGPVYHNGVEVEGILSTSVQFNTLFSPFRTSGNVYARQGYIARRSPMIQLTTLKCDTDAAVSHFLRAASGALAVYYWKGVDAGDRVAVGSSVHVKITAATSAFSDDSVTVSENDDGTTTITILPVGTLAYSVTSTIP